MDKGSVLFSVGSWITMGSVPAIEKLGHEDARDLMSTPAIVSHFTLGECGMMDPVVSFLGVERRNEDGRLDKFSGDFRPDDLIGARESSAWMTGVAHAADPKSCIWGLPRVSRPSSGPPARRAIQLGLLQTFRVGFAI